MPPKDEQVVVDNANGLPICKIQQMKDDPLSWETILICLATIVTFIFIAGTLKSQACKSSGYTQDLLSGLATTLSTAAAVGIIALIATFVMPDMAAQAMIKVRRKLYG